jgi:peptide/nickel transport system permease protein
VLFILGVFGWAGTSRLVDATTKQVLSEEYIAAARTLGARDRRIIFKHILPNILAPIIVVGTLGVATGILSEAGLTFLGFGSPADSVSWGTVLTQGVDNIKLHPQQTLIAGFAVFFIAMAVNLLGDALRDALDPRLKR